jgi:two-component system phosphate regulon response regulator OmpR
MVRFGRYTFDLDRQALSADGRPVRLTQAEAMLLKALALGGGTPLSREELHRRTNLAPNSRTIDVQVTRLRRKIEPEPRFPRYLQTVRGKGYALLTD